MTTQNLISQGKNIRNGKIYKENNRGYVIQIDGSFKKQFFIQKINCLL